MSYTVIRITYAVIATDFMELDRTKYCFVFLFLLFTSFYADQPLLFILSEWTDVTL